MVPKPIKNRTQMCTKSRKESGIQKLTAKTEKMELGKREVDTRIGKMRPEIGKMKPERRGPD